MFTNATGGMQISPNVFYCLFPPFLSLSYLSLDEHALSFILNIQTSSDNMESAESESESIVFPFLCTLKISTFEEPYPDSGSNSNDERVTISM